MNSSFRYKILYFIGGLAFIYLLVFNNCGRPYTQLNGNAGGNSTVTDPSQYGSGNKPSITYSEHIKPILQSRCVQCHHSKGIAPFSIINYSQAKALGPSLLSAVKSRGMPPWGAQEDGTCQSFHDSLWMSQSEINSLELWINEKFPEGGPTGNIETGSLSEHYNLNNSDIVEYKMKNSYNPPSQSPVDDYRCFITNEFNIPQTLIGFDVVPGNKNVVHHLIAYMPKTEEEEAKALSKGDAYSCFGGPGVDSSIVAFWAPGTGVTTYPQWVNQTNGSQGVKQTGLKIPAGRKLIFQIHYNFSSGLQSDQSSIRFKVSSSQIKEGVWLQFGKVGGAGVIPKGTSGFVHIESTQIGQALSGVTSTTSQSGYLYAVFPHMHQVGSKIKIEINRELGLDSTDSNSECLVKIPVWNFHWQRAYWFKRPVRINSLDTLKMSCTYNTLNKSTETYFGEGSDDEMCFMFGFVTDSNL